MIIIMINQFTSYFRFCTKLSKINLNSINPVGEFVAYGYYFPKEWTEDYIYSQLDPSRKKIIHIQLVPNRLGQSSGKVLFKFQTQNHMKHYIDKYNEDFIITKQSANRIIIKPFQLKTLQKKSQVEEKRTKHAVKVKNLDFDITKDQLQRLAQDYGTVQYIEMNLKPNGLNSGIATVFFSKSKQAVDFAYFCDLLVYRDRKLSTQIVNFHKDNSKTEIKFLQYPKITLEANDRIYKLKLVQQAQEKQKAQ